MLDELEARLDRTYDPALKHKTDAGSATEATPSARQVSHESTAQTVIASIFGAMRSALNLGGGGSGGGGGEATRAGDKASAADADPVDDGSNFFNPRGADTEELMRTIRKRAKVGMDSNARLASNEIASLMGVSTGTSVQFTRRAPGPVSPLHTVLVRTPGPCL